MAQIIPVAPFDCIVFGGTGDLTLRKLLPALYHRHRDEQITGATRLIAVARRALTREAYLARVQEWLQTHLGASYDAKVWESFAARITYVALDATGDSGWPDLSAHLAGKANKIRIFYLATASELFGPICQKLKASGLATPDSRIVLEKPIGTDLASARLINDEIGLVFSEAQIYRIDHYLGKETVQNLLALRFANSLFEPLWSSARIDHVQITVAESVGLEGRAGYYDKSGALRDMVQNHLLQLLCLIAMEPPRQMDKDAVRDEKLKVLRALKPMKPADMPVHTVRGQYKAGASYGGSVPGYLDELGHPSLTETFVALKVEIENWRWAGVPFYLRTGKRMSSKISEISLQFRPVPHSIFPGESGRIEPNRLVVRLQPDEGIRLHMMTKEPGPGGMRLRSASLNLSFAETFKLRTPDAYERLLMDVVRGNATLFMRRDEVEAAWAWVAPILEDWERRAEAPRPYVAGTDGPAAAIALIERDGRTWNEENA